ncbi:VOC family protein [Candidatus Peregrinibacteria bacterium]|nr:MAG: VOC family protein [Candidatus Peregrinibacteria bacterium]
MQKITPHLWFDKEAKEAAAFYVDAFQNSRIKSSTTLSGTPSGSVDLLTIELWGMDFSLISAGPYFQFTPAISFLVTCESKEAVDALWEKLGQGGKVLMELGAYPFSERYGWLQDQYGLSWQVMFTTDASVQKRIVPTLMFVGEQCGKAEEAVHSYALVFRGVEVDHILRYESGEEPDKEGTVKHLGFTLEGQPFAAMDSARVHDFGFNEAVSFVVNCETQEELDAYWEKLSAVPEAEQCGWLKDKFGVSWQIVPTIMDEMLLKGAPEQVARVTEAFLKMKKFDIATLKEAYEGVEN